MSNKNEYGRKIVRYIRKTAGNKLVALLLICGGLASRMVSTDATALVFILIFAIPLFFAKKNYIVL